jgi:CrcB protein
MPWIEFLAVGVGAAVGAWVRWGFASWLNAVHPTVPLGTLAANLVGGLLVGIFMALALPYQLTDTQRLLIATGFLGGLTTFSTFSAETVALLIEARYAGAAGIVLAHLLGSLLMTGLGWVLAKAVLARF